MTGSTLNGQALIQEYESAQKHFGEILKRYIQQWPSGNQFRLDVERNFHGISWLHLSQCNTASEHKNESACFALMSDGDKDLGPKFWKALAGHNQVVAEKGQYAAIRMQDGSVPTASELWASCYGEGPWMILPIEPRDMKLIEMQQRIEQLQAQLEELQAID